MSLSTTNFTVFVLASYLSVAVNVTVIFASPAPINVISPVSASIVSTFVSSIEYLTFPIAASEFDTVIVGTILDVNSTLLALNVTSGVGCVALSILIWNVAFLSDASGLSL